MKHLFILFIAILFFNTIACGQNTTCANAIRLCLNTPVTYPASTGAGAAETGPDYGCLASRPNPAWFTFQIDNPGTHTISQTNSTNRDLDFILYGPFSQETGNCGNLTAANTADCSYAGGATETIEFTSLNQGEFYILLVTNFSNQATNVTFTQTAGTGTYDCNFTGPCQISQISVIPGACDSLTNTYTLQGSVFSFYPPVGGQLIVSAGGESQTLNGPFNNTTNFSISGLPSNGTLEEITASFNISAGCSASANYTAPSGCLPCQASAIANGPVCEGGTLELTTDYPALADYQWSGPNSFSSTSPNPVIENVSDLATGVYTVLIEGDNCISERSVEVEIIGAPNAVITTPSDSICEGDILFLGASDIPGASWSWTGPDSFTAVSRNTQIANAGPQHSGWYIVSAERAGCTGMPDSVFYQVNPSPAISMSGDTIQTPGEAGVIYVSGPGGMTYFWNFIGDETLIDLAVYTGNGDTLAAFWADREGNLKVEVVGVDENGCTSNEASLNLEITYAISANQLPNEHFLLFYPNPARDYLNISNKYASEIEYAIYSSVGKLIFRSKANSNSTEQINLNGIAPGLYYIRMGNHFSKLLVER